MLTGGLLLALALQSMPQVEIAIGPATGATRGISEGSNLFAGHSATLREALAYAYDVDRSLIFAPGWFDEDRFDFVAKSKGEGGDVRAAFQQALTEKFSLACHRETRFVDVWVMRDPLGTGPGLREAPPGPPGNLQVREDVELHLWARAAPFDTVVQVLRHFLKSVLADETDLDGNYTFEVRWKKGDSDAMIRAWRDLGIELSREPRQMEVLVIDAALRPEPPGPDLRACEAAPEIRAALDALPRMEDYSRSFEERMAPRRALAAKYPDDVFVQMRVQDAIRTKPHLTGEWDRAIAGYREGGGPVLGPYLEARLLLPAEGAYAKSVLFRAIGAAEFPWAHLALVEWTEVKGRRDPALAGRELKKFRELCPGSLAAFAHYRAIEDPPVLREAEATLRRLLSRRDDAEAAAAWAHDWDLLGRIAPRESARRQIGQDIARLRTLPHLASEEWMGTLLYGCDLAGDAACRTSLENDVLRYLGYTRLAYSVARGRWMARHPQPAAGVPPEQRAAWHNEFFAVSQAWRGRWPQLPQVTFDRWRYRPEAASDREALALADEYLAAAARYPDLAFSVPPPAMQVAELYAARKLRLDRVPALTERALREVEEQEKYRPRAATRY